jgi:hypothetical protein
MERTVPSTASDEVDLYLRTYYSLLRSTADVQIRTLEEVHAGANSLLHPKAREQAPDTSAFIYSILRLPLCMSDVQLVILGQSIEVFGQHGFQDVESWESVEARARRRRCFYNGRNTLACIIASRSDIDDVIPILTAYQIEWNKLHFLLQSLPNDLDLTSLDTDPGEFLTLANSLNISLDDLERLRIVWGNAFIPNLKKISQNRCALRVRLLSGSLSEYRRATHAWWMNIVSNSPGLCDHPIYVISSNPHSIANVLSGFVFADPQLRTELIDFLNQEGNESLRAEWQAIQAEYVLSSQENFLYYVLKKYQQTPSGHYLVERQYQHEVEYGITRIPSEHYFDVEAQVIQLSLLEPAIMDPRLRGENESTGSMEFLKGSDALILNMDYPLGLAAYHILSKIAEHASTILGVYVVGKSAALNGIIGDVMIPNVVHDEHSRNTYLFKNCFEAADVAPYLIYGTVLDNQKTVSVLGTFLQNAKYMDVFYREGYTDIEMEAGSYLSAVYEMYRPKRHPMNEIVNLYEIPFDLGILHYVSDTPLSKGKNLGAGTLSYFGMDSTYAATIAALKRILHLERARIKL